MLFVQAYYHKSGRIGTKTRAGTSLADLCCMLSFPPPLDPICAIQYHED